LCSEIVLFYALTSDSSLRFIEPGFPRLSLGEYTGIKKGETSQKQARPQQRSPESNPDRKEVREEIGSLGHLIQHERVSEDTRESKAQRAFQPTDSRIIIPGSRFRRFAERKDQQSKTTFWNSSFGDQHLETILKSGLAKQVFETLLEIGS